MFFEDLEVCFVFDVEQDFYFIAKVAAFFFEASAELGVGEGIVYEFALLV